MYANSLNKISFLTIIWKRKGNLKCTNQSELEISDYKKTKKRSKTLLQRRCTVTKA